MARGKLARPMTMPSATAATSDSSLLTAFLVVGIGALLLAVGWSIRALRRDAASPYRWIAGAVPIGWFSVAVSVVAIAVLMPFRDWSGARLAWSAALDHGYGLYSGLEEGPVLSSIYGPVSPLLFWPALLIGDITWAMVAGSCINMLTCLGPLLVLVRWGRGKARDGRIVGQAAFIFAVASVLVLPSTRNLTHNIHVDAAAVGLGLLSCVLLFGDSAPTGRRLTFAALFTALAVWTKQVEITLGAAQALYLFLAFGFSVVWAFFWRVAVFGLGLGAVFVLWFGFDGMWFHMWTIPSGHPMAQYVELEPERIEYPPSLRLILGELVWWSVPFVGLVLLLQMLTPRGDRRWLRSDWALLLLVAAALFPTSVLARAKVGGWVNSYHTHYFVVAAATIALVRFFDRFGGRIRVARIGLAGLLVASIAVLWSPVHLKGLEKIPELHDNPQRRVYDFAREHPGEAWFPWHPLACLLAEGKLYHFYYAMVDRDISGRRMSREYIDRHMPAKMRYIVHNQMWVAGRDPLPWLSRYLPEFDEPAQLPGFPGWTVLTNEK